MRSNAPTQVSGLLQKPSGSARSCSLVFVGTKDDFSHLVLVVDSLCMECRDELREERLRFPIAVHICGLGQVTCPLNGVRFTPNGFGFTSGLLVSGQLVFPLRRLQR